MWTEELGRALKGGREGPFGTPPSEKIAEFTNERAHFAFSVGWGGDRRGSEHVTAPYAT